LLFTLPNTPLRAVPTWVKMLTIARKIPLATSAYSIAVAPLSSAMNLRAHRNILLSSLPQPIQSAEQAALLFQFFDPIVGNHH
jgi:hypothetical protein